MAQPGEARAITSEWDTNQQRRFAFPGESLSTGMIRRNLGCAFLTGDPEELVGILNMYARGRCMISGWNVQANHLVLTALELAGPNLPDNRFVPRRGARKWFVYGIGRFLATSSLQNQLFSVEAATLANAQILDDALAQEKLRTLGAHIATPGAVALHFLGDGHDGVDYDITDEQINAVARVAAWLIKNHKTNRVADLGANAYVLMYLSISKRGQITADKLRSVSAAIERESNRRIDLTSEEIAICASNIGGVITAENARLVMTTLSTNMEGISLRLRLLMDQTAKAGMTAYWSIREACRIFPDFPWPEAARYIPDEFTAFDRAVARVQDNEYYGFASNLGDARHTLYKSLAWLAIKLLIKCRASSYGSLANYRGIGQADRQADLQRLVDNYNPTALAAPPAGAGAQVARWANAVYVPAVPGQLHAAGAQLPNPFYDPYVAPQGQQPGGGYGGEPRI